MFLESVGSLSGGGGGGDWQAGPDQKATDPSPLCIHTSSRHLAFLHSARTGGSRKAPRTAGSGRSMYLYSVSIHTAVVAV
jgi:hypothetical protein